MSGAVKVGTSIARNLGAVVLAAALLVSTLAGLSYGGQSGIDEPEEITLLSPGGTFFGVRVEDSEGNDAGIDFARDRVSDVDGNRVGTVRTRCLNGGIVWACTSIVSLRSGVHTEDGTVVLEGLFGGFNGESVAVTGGTGAYANVRGTATLTVIDDQFAWVLHLIP
jgi:hypothetical protein